MRPWSDFRGMFPRQESFDSPILSGDHNVSLLIEDHDHGNHDGQIMLYFTITLEENAFKDSSFDVNDGQRNKEPRAVVLLR